MPSNNSPRIRTSPELESEKPTEVSQILKLLVGVILVAVLLDLYVLPRVRPKSDFHPLVDHVVLALYVAAVVGFTYELGLHAQRERMLRRFLSAFRSEAFRTLRGYAALRPGDVFGLLKDIASRTDEIPTLYHPPRQTREYKFVQEVKYFDALVKVSRYDVVAILRDWLTPNNHRNVRFLASDLAGYYELHELKDDLLSLAKEPWDNWSLLSVDDRDCVLNYFWAASRCEEKRYHKLGTILRTTPDEHVQRWILFVPRQMPDKEFCHIIDKYLDRKNLPIAAVRDAVWALAALAGNGHVAAIVTLEKHMPLFDSLDLRTDIDLAWQQYGLESPFRS